MPRHKLAFRLVHTVPMYYEMPDDAVEALDVFFSFRRTWADVRKVIRAVYPKISKAATHARLHRLMAEAREDYMEYDRTSVFEEAFPAWAKLRADAEAYAIRHNYEGYESFVLDITYDSRLP